MDVHDRGSYVSTSLMFNEFPLLSDLVFGNNASGIAGWQLDESLFAPGPSGEYEEAFFGHLFDDLGAKRSAGDFPVTFCDLWGRAVSRSLTELITSNKLNEWVLSWHTTSCQAPALLPHFSLMKRQGTMQLRCLTLPLQACT